MTERLERIIPNYDKTPVDCTIAGRAMDQCLIHHFNGQDIMIRGIDSRQHAGMTRDQLIKKILGHGTDRYDPEYRPFWMDFDVYKNAGIDLFAVRQVIGADLNIMTEFVMDFTQGAQLDRGYTLRPDILMIYDPACFDMIPIHYAENDIGEDAWRFKPDVDRPKALHAIILINSKGEKTS